MYVSGRIGQADFFRCCRVFRRDLVRLWFTVAIAELNEFEAVLVGVVEKQSGGAKLQFQVVQGAGDCCP